MLRERRSNPSTALSGGQQQMVAIGRALMSNPRVLLCDEISLGLAPVVIRDIYAAFPRIRASGASLIIVEQDIGQALKVADRVYCMMEGPRHPPGPRRPTCRARPSTPPISEPRDMHWLDTIVQGVLLGGLYALFAAGLSLVFGIMRLVNLAHGDLIVLAAYLILVLVTRARARTRSSRSLLAMPLMFAARLGAAVQPAQPHARRATSCRRCWSLSAFRSSSRTRCWKVFPPTAGASRSAAWKPLRSASARSASASCRC